MMILSRFKLRETNYRVTTPGSQFFLFMMLLSRSVTAQIAMFFLVLTMHSPLKLQKNHSVNAPSANNL